MLALSFGGFASAQVIINVAGSTAFRTAAVNGEVAAVSFASGSTTGSPIPATPVSGYTTLPGSTATNGATISIVHGWLKDGTEVYYRNHWTGSAAGVVDLSIGNTTLTWLPISTLGSLTTSGAGLAVGTEVADGTAPAVAMTDAQALDGQNSVITGGAQGPTFAAKIGTAISSGSLVDAGPGTPVAAVVFEWVLGVQSDGNPAPFTNVTQQQAAALVKNGFLPLNVFTGNTSDVINFVMFTGRNEDSGTRIGCYAEAQTGFGQPAVQYMIKQTNFPYPPNNAYAFSSSTALSVDTSIDGFQAWPKTSGSNSWSLITDPTLDWKTIGHSGYYGGGDVATILRTPNPVATTGWTVSNPPPGFTVGTSKCYIISGMGVSDGNKVTSGNTVNGTAMTYNGVPFSTANVIAGNYSYYTFEHEYYLIGTPVGSQNVVGVGTEAQSAADAIATSLLGLTQSQLGAAGVPYNSLSFTSRSAAAGTYIN
jgi:hypothetical protein